MMKIFVCGNPLVKKDCLPFKILPLLRKRFPNLKIFSIDPNEDFFPEDGSLIIDTVLGIAGVQVFEDIKKFCQTRLISSHNFDLGTHLLLLKKLGRLSKIKIIGIPPFLSIQEAFLETSLIMNKEIQSSKPINL